MGRGVALFDYDNDGWKDLLIAQGHDLDTIELNYPNLHYREPMLLARNTGHGLGPGTTIKSIEIRWPSRIKQTLKNVPADQLLQVDEPALASQVNK